MVRLHLTVEGQTEAAFVRDVLAFHLANYQVYVSNPRFTGPSRRKPGNIPRRGMFYKFEPTLRDMRLWLNKDRNHDARFSMMVDYYGLPKDFPGTDTLQDSWNFRQRVEHLENSLAQLINDQRFIPYLQVHEFESLVFSSPLRLEQLFPLSEATKEKFRGIVAKYPDPEEINSGQHSHPKKRIKDIIPNYDETVSGPEVLKAIGLDQLKRSCKHFGNWLRRLEGLAGIEPG